MGKNLPAKKYKIGNRTERFLHYELAHTGSSTDSHFIDLAAGLSAVNKRFYRQGLYYYIKSISVIETTGDTKIQFGTAPDAWMVPQAWKLGFRNWSKMNSEAARTIPGGDLAIAGKYHDFKIYLNNNHRGETDVTVPTNGPTTIDGSPHYNPDAWDYSQYHTLHPGPSDQNDADRDSFSIMLLGSHVAGGGGEDAYAAVSLIESYRNQRTLLAGDEPTQMDNIGDDPLLQLFDSANQYDDIIDDLQDMNDKAPYDDNGTYTDTMLRAQGHAFAQAGGNLMLPGFCVPLGLLEVMTTCGGDNTVKVLIELAPGPYHGVYAERIV
tara:strand:- start:66 stop:1034 length:969 start_codon:yes stop_codon:yes gene_type:complete